MNVIDRKKIPMKENIKINFKRYIYDLADDDAIAIEVTRVRKDGAESNCFMPARDITIEEAWLDVVKSLFPSANVMVEDEYIDGAGDTNE